MSISIQHFSCGLVCNLVVAGTNRSKSPLLVCTTIPVMKDWADIQHSVVRSMDHPVICMAERAGSGPESDREQSGERVYANTLACSMGAGLVTLRTFDF